MANRKNNDPHQAILLHCLVWIIVFPVGHCIVWCGSLFFLLAIALPGVDHCFSYWPLYCLVWIIVFPVVHCIAWCGSLFFLSAIVLPGVDHCFSCWPLYCLVWIPGNTMVNRKNNDPHQAIQWPTGKTMIHTRQYNGQQEKQ
jgi:sulfite exporter TauE/SafE